MDIGSSEWSRLIIKGAKRFNVEVCHEKTKQFAAHAVELVKWTRKINLTTITDPKEVAIKHFLDSIAPAAWIPEDASLLDIGSGGGFPGIPLKIMLPSLSVTLIDSSRKKISFLNHVIRTLNLYNIEALHLRSENFEPNRQFDVIVSRALSALDEFVPQAWPLLAKNGVIVALKGLFSEAQTEYKRLLSDSSGCFPEMVEKWFSVDFKNYTLPYSGAERTLVIIRFSHRVSNRTYS